MAKYYQDFIGLNTFMYEPNGYNVSASQQAFPGVYSFGREAVSHIDFFGEAAENYIYFNQNFIGADLSITPTGFRTTNLGAYKNYHFPHKLPDTASFFNALMSRRNGPYGYPMWKQTRTSHNHLSRKQRKENIFTFMGAGEFKEMTLNGNTQRIITRLGAIKTFREPVVNSSHSPLEMMGRISITNPNTNEEEERLIKIQTTFGNETTFFATPEINDYFNTVAQTDENYEDFKNLYLNRGLDGDQSPFTSFKYLKYKQTVWPQERYAFLNQTRQRTFFVNKFWRDDRQDRTEIDQDGVVGFADQANGQFTKRLSRIPRQSMWPLDVQSDWATRGIPSQSAPNAGKVFAYYIGGDYVNSALFSSPTFAGAIGGYNTGADLSDRQNPRVADPALTSSQGGGAGVLMNSYSQLVRGQFGATGFCDPAPGVSLAPDTHRFLTASCYYSRRHTINTIESVVSPTGMVINETGSQTAIATGSLYEGLAAWDAGNQHGSGPFYDSYEDFSQEIKLKGQGYSIIPEFRMSSHVKTYESKGATEELKEIFELSGAFSANTTTENQSTFYRVLSNSDFLKHFELIKKDHEDFAEPISVTLRCKAIKKFLPYEGFYPAERAVQMSQQFFESYHNGISLFQTGSIAEGPQPFALQPLIENLFAPGILFNSIKSGVACSYKNPALINSTRGATNVNLQSVDADLTTHKATSDRINYFHSSSADLTGSGHAATGDGGQGFQNKFLGLARATIPFEALVAPQTTKLASQEFFINEPNPFGLVEEQLSCIWDGSGDNVYTKFASNFLAEVPEFFLENGNFSSINSLASDSPSFGNALSGTYYTMRVKMYKSVEGLPDPQQAIIHNPIRRSGEVSPILIETPQYENQIGGCRENFTMYSRPSAFGPPILGDAPTINGSVDSVLPRQYQLHRTDDLSGSNYVNTPPYYNGQAWCDLIFYATETKKYTLTEILQNAQRFPYYTRHWSPQLLTISKLTGYEGFHHTPESFYETYNLSPWKKLIMDEENTDSAGAIQVVTSSNERHTNAAVMADWDGSARYTIPKPPATSSYQSSYHLDYSAMQLFESVNIFGKGKITRPDVNTEIISDAVSDVGARWVIQPKFETPMLNFNSYSSLEASGLTSPQFASESVPRGMWHQKGVIEEDPAKGIFLQVVDIPPSWLSGELGISKPTIESNLKLGSLAELCGFDTSPVRLGKVSNTKKVSEAVVAVPFVEEDGTRKFFSLEREDVSKALEQLSDGYPNVNLEVGKSIVEMVRKMKKYVFPPSMDFIRTPEIQPFSMYIFEFEHSFSRTDIANIWQNLPPELGRSFEEAESSIGHALLSRELLGNGDINTPNSVLPDRIQWMVFKVKQRANRNYFSKVVRGNPLIEGPAQLRSSAFYESAFNNSLLAPEDQFDINNPSNNTEAIRKSLEVSFNWPYDFFSLVELVKLDAEVFVGNVDPTDKKTFTPSDNAMANKIRDINKSRQGIRGETDGGVLRVRQVAQGASNNTTTQPVNSRSERFGELKK